jgi:hypothetical protein
MRISAGVACLTLLLQATGFTQSENAASTPAQAKLALEIVLQREEGDEWQSVDAGTVFHRDDAIRFRFHTSRGGYLYVLNRSSNGESAWLFPRPQEGQNGRVEPGPEYLIPGTKGAFVVAGSPGFDVTYWILSPTPIAIEGASPPVMGSQPSTLEPRCRTDTLKAPGLCVDDRAGPGPIRESSKPPLPALGNSKLLSRELKFRSDKSATHISSADPKSKVIIYEFRIAHD